MVARLTGALALTGGLAWFVKVALIWANGGSNTTDGLVGVFFTIGAVAIVLAATIRAWHWPSVARLRSRVVASLVAVAAFAAAVNLPIWVGWQIFGKTWLAEEVGVLLTALVAVGLGARWLRVGFGGAAHVPRSADASGV
jgi:hypothetical protein